MASQEKEKKAADLKKVDLNFIITDEKGEDIPKAHAGEIVGSFLASMPEGDALKLFGWARRFAAHESIDMDKSDLAMFKEVIEKSKLPVLTRSQVLECLI